MGQRYLDLNEEERLERDARALRRIIAGEDKQKVLDEERDGFDFDGCRDLGFLIHRLPETEETAGGIMKGALEIASGERIDATVQIHDSDRLKNASESCVAVYSRHDNGYAKSDEVTAWIVNGLARTGENVYALLLKDGRMIATYRKQADGNIVCIVLVLPLPDNWSLPFVGRESGETCLGWQETTMIVSPWDVAREETESFDCR